MEMAHRLTVQSSTHDARGENFRKVLQERFPRVPLREVGVTTSYSIDASLTLRDLNEIGRELAHPTVERFSHQEVLAPKKFTFGIEVGFLPGVTDNVGATAKQMIADVLDQALPSDTGVYSSLFVFLRGDVSRAEAEAMSQELYNPLIERAHVFSYTEFARQGVPIRIPKVALPARPQATRVNLEVSDDELLQMGKEGIANPDGSRRGPLALSLPELHAIRNYFRGVKRNPTDVELESLAQTWSEHCKHTIFNDPLDEIQEGIFRRYISGATEKIRRQLGKRDFCVSVFKDNSGAIAFDDTYLVTHKVETHNSPSALDPFGGSVTGVVGVNRDTLGFGLGAEPIANIYGFCVGSPKDKRDLFHDPNRTQKLLPARRIFEGVIRGINAGGNQSGIPTPLGFVAVDDSFRGKPLVFAGTVGLLPKRAGRRLLHQKKARPGDYIVMIGGRVGLDGIHGATFSSEVLSTGSPATAVQIGDPITQKKFSDALIREARDQGMYASITDNGAGGLSCSVAEMARECGGCSVDLEKVPVKYPGLAPWQIWISESQERMTLAVPKQKWSAAKRLFQKYGVEATRIGTFTRTPRCVVKYQGSIVMDLAMSFLHEGRPVRQQDSRKPRLPEKSSANRKGESSLHRDVLSVLARPNVGSFSFISEQYDHEVQGTSVTKPLQGRGRVNAEAAVIRPVRSSQRGIVLAHGYCPTYSAIDTYAMAAAALDTAVRNAVAAGASLYPLALLDNFCWSSGNSPERLHQLKEAARACFDGAVAYGTPFISGKDSMFNDFRGFTKDGSPIHLAALPTLLISALGVIPHVNRAITLDWKCPGNALYLLGETHDELGESEYAVSGAVNSPARVPETDFNKNKKLYRAFARANQSGDIASALGISRGGLIVALAKMAVAGQIGADIRLPALGTAVRRESILFSESQGRIIAEIPAKRVGNFEHLMKKSRVPFQKVGQVTPTPELRVSERGRAVDSYPVRELTQAYRSAFKDFTV